MHPILCELGLLLLLIRDTGGAAFGTEIHCTRTIAIQGDSKEMDNLGKQIRVKSISSADLTLKETLCLNFTESALPQMHAMEFVRMEQHFPVSASYKFGIPLVTSSCICDCAGAEQYCTVESYRYKNCTKGAVCYRTFHSQQSNLGCISSAPSDVCCEVSLEPYNGKIFTAAQLSQPDTIIVLRHRIYERIANRWAEAATEEFDVVVNKGSAKIESVDRQKVEIRISSSRAIREIYEGMYYYSDDERLLMTGVRLNEPTENDIHKLGWLRKQDGLWNVRNGIVKITDSQHVTVENCKAQKYQTRYNAEYYVTDVDALSGLDMGYRADAQVWVDRVTISPDGRSVRVIHGEGTAIHLTVSSDTRPLIVQFTSQINSFNGSIQMDDRSNRFLNLTIQGGKGTLIGYVHQSEDKTVTEWSFSLELGASVRQKFMTTVGGIPPDINSDRYICIHPSGDIFAEICKWLRYEAMPLRERHVAHRWKTAVGDCPGCNERGFDNFLQKLDPRQWFDGMTSPTEIATCLLEIALIVASFLATVCIFKNCIIPLAKWTICMKRPTKK